MSFADTAVLFVLALLLFGPKKLPGIARQVGKLLNEFKRASNEFKAQIESEINQMEFQEKQKAREQEKQEEQKIVPPVAAAPDSVPAQRSASQIEPGQSSSENPTNFTTAASDEANTVVASNPSNA
jgi:sec-independent protein translocase protein TatB